MLELNENEKVIAEAKFKLPLVIKILFIFFMVLFCILALAQIITSANALSDAKELAEEYSKYSYYSDIYNAQVSTAKSTLLSTIFTYLFSIIIYVLLYVLYMFDIKKRVLVITNKRVYCYKTVCLLFKHEVNQILKSIDVVDKKSFLGIHTLNLRISYKHLSTTLKHISCIDNIDQVYDRLNKVALNTKVENKETINN